MLQEMNLENALKKFLKGKKVLVMHNETLFENEPHYHVESLKSCLEQKRFLVEVPAVENPDFAELFGECKAVDASNIQTGTIQNNAVSNGESVPEFEELLDPEEIPPPQPLRRRQVRR